MFRGTAHECDLIYGAVGKDYAAEPSQLEQARLHLPVVRLVVQRLEPDWDRYVRHSARSIRDQ